MSARSFFVSGLPDVAGADLGPDRGTGLGVPPAFAPPASWYLRGDVGYAWMDANDPVANSFTFSSVSVDNTWGLAAGIGTYFGRGVRGDLTYLNGGPARTCTPRALRAPISSSTPRCYWPTFITIFVAASSFTPYLGVGAAFHSTGSGTVTLTCCGTCNFDGESKWTPAAALMAGLSWRLDRQAAVSIKDGSLGASRPGRLHVDLGYRFLYLGDANTGHAIGIAPARPGPPP